MYVRVMKMSEGGTILSFKRMRFDDYCYRRVNINAFYITQIKN